VLPNFTFAVADNTTGMNGPYDGILGLGFRTISTGGVPTVFGALVESGQLAEPVFGFFLGSNEQAGQLVLGGVDPDHFVGDFHYVNLSHASYWAVTLDAVRLGAEMSLTASHTAIVDSGTSLLVGPAREVHVLATMLGAIQVRGFYVVPCGELPSLSFVLGGRAFTLEIEDLVIDRTGPFCELGIQGAGHGMPQNFWILGDVFMRKYYVQFDWGQQRLGFAQSSSHVGGNYV